jgi:hypothetical protein
MWQKMTTETSYFVFLLIVRENIKTSDKDNRGYQKLKHNKPWFHDECSNLIDQRKQGKLQWLQNPSQNKERNLQILRSNTSRTFRKKKRECLKGKNNELETNNKNKIIIDLYRGLSEFKKWYQHRINIVKYKNGNLLVDTQVF